MWPDPFLTKTEIIVQPLSRITQTEQSRSSGGTSVFHTKRGIEDEALAVGPTHPKPSIRLAPIAHPAIGFIKSAYRLERFRVE